MNGKIKRAATVALVSISLGLGGLALSAAPAQAASPKMSNAEYRQVRDGMILKRVRAIADGKGKRTRSYEKATCKMTHYGTTDDGEEVWDCVWVTAQYSKYRWNRNGGGSAYVTFKNGRVTSKDKVR